MSAHRAAARVEEIADRSDRRFTFVVALVALAYIFMGVTLWLAIDLRATVDTNSRKRQTQLARIEAKVDHLNATLAFLDTGRER